MAKNVADIYIANHECPVQRADANFLIFADISERDSSIEWEQLWARQLGDNKFRLCCIPFFTYGLALGDQVITEEKWGKDYVIRSRIRKSGHLAYRVWFGDVDNAIASRNIIEKHVSALGWLFEWSSKNLLAIDVPSESDENGIRSFLSEHSHTGILFESGE